MRTIVICTPEGFSQVALDANGRPVDSDSAPGELCEWCQAFGVVVTPSAPTHATYLDLSLTAVSVVPADDLSRGAQHSERPYLIRGPPL